MTKITVEQLVWDEFNSNHIQKHHVTKADVEETLNHILAHRSGKRGKLIVIGRCGKRILSLILGREESHTYYLVTARDADKKERKLIYEKENNI